MGTVGDLWGIFGVHDLYVASSWIWPAFWVLWLVWGLITTRQRAVVKGDGGISPTIRLVVILVALVYFGPHFPSYLQARALWPGYSSLMAAGFLLEVLGLGLAVWARYYLGSFWSSAAVLREGHRVVDTGPYRLVRHPIYSGILLALLGTFLMAGSTLWLGILVVVVVIFGWKIRAEERLLTTELGEEYVNYRSRTRRLIPWLL